MSGYFYMDETADLDAVREMVDRRWRQFLRAAKEGAGPNSTTCQPAPERTVQQ